MEQDSRGHFDEGEEVGKCLGDELGSEGLTLEME